ncbi:iron-siderophore ABC transporter iron-siderophore-binging protein [Bacillus sp. TS-2]|nr:iron-siderophore ABC transporter iron-siderophore-binging protein [Bacillus sp. TS-2]
MGKYIFILFLVSLLSGCFHEEIKEEEVVALVDGREITLKDIRSINIMGGEESLLKMIVNYTKEEVAVLEAQDKGIQVTENVEVLMDLVFPLGESGNEHIFEKKANELGITIEEYYETYYKKRLERDEYINQLINKEFDLLNVDEADIEEYIQTLLEKYEVEILL